MSAERAEEAIHANRARALSFGGIAALYDRARPTYPTALVDTLMEWAPHDVLDVGCGTGKASRLLIDRGCTVLGVEPDGAMAAIARSHGVTVEEGTFEHWDAGRRMFDLVMSGQAWHWVEPVAGAAKAASLLRPGGHLAVFWNRGSTDPEVAAALGAVYDRLAPSITSSMRLHREIPSAEERNAVFVRTGQFSDAETRTYSWEATYDRAQWLDFLSTHSYHVLLPDAQRAIVLGTIGDVIDSFGGTIAYHFSTLLLIATRAG